MPAPGFDLGVPLPPIEDPKGELEKLYTRFARLVRKRLDDRVRIAVYGDSNMTRDYISGEMRRVLQGRYGDGGHGYVAIGKPWPWYTHQDVEHGIEPKAWRSHAVSTHAVLDDAYGFAGIAAQSISNGARAWVSTKAGAPVGNQASRVDVLYLMHPRGGRLEVRIDDQSRAKLETRAKELAVGFSRFDVPDGPHKVQLRGDLGARPLGIVLERDVPGVVVDSLGVGGAKINHFARIHEATARAALEKRGYDLVMVLTGATEDDAEPHDAALGKFIDRHRAALPNAACLVMSPPDFDYGTLKHPRKSFRIVGLGRRKHAIALAKGCAFWDFHAAMGGDLSMARFAEHQLAWGDMAHLNDAGGAVMARRFLQALWADFGRWAAAHPNAGCEV